MAKQDPSKLSKEYQDALKAVNGIVEGQQQINKLNESFYQTTDLITKSLFEMGSSDFFKEIKKTPQDLANSFEQIKNIKNELKTAGRELTTAFNNKEIFKGFDEFRKNLKGVAVLDLSSIKEGLTISPENIKVLQKEIELLKDRNSNIKNDEEAIRHINANFNDFNNLASLGRDTIKAMTNNIDNIYERSSSLEQAFENFPDTLNELRLAFSDVDIKSLVEHSDDLNKYLEKNGEQGEKMLSVLFRQDKELLKQLGLYTQINDRTKETIKNLEKSTKTISNISSGLEKMSKNLTMGLKDFIFNYDKIVSDAQKNTGIMFKENSAAMADLTSQTQAYGMNLTATVEMMGQLSDKLSTTDFNVLSKAASDFSVISRATGVSSEQITDIASELIMMGSSTESVKENFEVANKQAQMLGVSSRKVISQIERNITKMREFGFTGGIKSLTKMAAEAERLRIQVDDIFNVAKRARNIEGALEMAAELQLAGGTFSNINPMDLLSAARKGPEELGKILTQMGGDIGRWSKDVNGEMTFAFDPVDVDRLQIVADATGLSLDTLQKTITKNAEDNKKLEFFPKSMFQFEGGDEAKNMIANLSEIGNGGTIKFKGDSKTLDLLKKAGVSADDFSNLTKEQIEKLTELQKEEAKTLEEQNAKNASFNESLDNLKGTFMNMFALLEPVIVQLTEWLQSFIKMVGGLSPEMKKIIAVGLAMVAAFSLFGPAVSMLGGIMGSFASTAAKLGGTLLKTGGGILEKITGGSLGGGMKNAGSGILGKVANKAADVQKGSPDLNGKTGTGGFFSSLATGIKAFGQISPKDLLIFSSALIIIGGALIGFGAAIAAVGGEASLAQLGTMGASLVLLGGSLFLLSKLKVDAKNILIMSLAMAVVGAALIPFAFAAKMLTDVDMMSVLASIGILTLVIVGLTVLGALMMGPQIAALALGVAILASVSVGLLLFSSSMLLAAVAFEKLSTVDWASLNNMGSTLINIAPGLLAFSLAAMAFVNPLALVGILVMTGALIGLSAVIVPLSEAMNFGAEGFVKFADGLSKLGEAVAKFDISKFDQIAESSERMASSSILTGVGNMLSSIVGGNKSNTISEKKIIQHEIILKFPNGRELQRLIIEDTDQ